ncbi:methionine ABC transporter ATP-binding protein [Brochothrix campestris]|uniref:ABC transporter ATP-binding protein n=1 Tax=Brochothrix campestris FSL F6-1037 TaxID=1265861 RepID=W7D7P8_9LIST|nr:methionine ABC transporter ATP-binding protein [Brochothrix campestris]EUJ41383.1 ABC transporter ATP-binding protein [Brochothrix campestris FSL F6-1037]
MIELKNISKDYTVDKKVITALKDVSVQVNAGEIYGVIGYSGAGKSTLIRCINLLETPTTGQVFIDGVNLQVLDKIALRQARQKIGMIFQGYNLLTTATVYDNIAIPLKLTGLSKEVIAERVEKYLGIVGLSDRATAYPAQLSGGQKQRVAIARALSHEPEILLSDEATSALDPNTTESILALLLEINEKLGLTIFLITHELSVIQRLCDRVAVMENGEIVEQGTVVEVFTQPRSTVTKSFLKNSAKYKIPEKIVGAFDQTGVLIQCTFVGDAASQPALAYVSKHFNVVPNIIAGGIDQFKNEAIGNLIVHLEGRTADITNTITYLESQAIIVTKEGVLNV